MTSEGERFRGSVASDSGEFFAYFCQPCGKLGQNLEAEGYCENCAEFLCSRCYDIHKIPTALRHHVLLDKESMQKLDPPVPETGTDMCPMHDQDIKFFCPTHMELACQNCKADKHSDCDTVEGIPQDIANSSEYRELKDTLQDTDHKLEQVHVKLHGKKAASNESFTAAVQDIKMFKEGIISIVNDIESTLLEKAELYERNNRGDLDRKIDTVNELSQELNSQKVQLEELESSKLFAHLYMAMKKAEKRLKTIQTAFDHLTLGESSSLFKFLPNLKIKDVISEPEGLGMFVKSTPDCEESECMRRCSSISSDLSCASLPDVTEEDLPTEQDLQDDEQPTASDEVPEGLIEANHLEDLHVDSKHSKHPCWITGATVFGDDADKLAVTDYNNCTVNVVYLGKDTGTLLQLKLSKGPWDVVEIDYSDLGSNYSATRQQSSTGQDSDHANVGTISQDSHQGAISGRETQTEEDASSLCDSQKKDSSAPQDNPIKDNSVLHDSQKKDTYSLSHSQKNESSKRRHSQDKDSSALGDTQKKTPGYQFNQPTGHALHESQRIFPVPRNHHPKQIIAVSIPEKHQLVFLQVGTRRIYHQRKMKVGGECYGLAYNKGRLLVSYKSPAKVEIMTRAGKVLRKIQTDETGQSLFSFPAYVAFSPAGARMFVSDRENNSITMVTTDGKVEKILKDDSLKCPTNLTVDENGNIFVCGRDSKNVVVMDSRMRTVQALLLTPVPPYCLCYRRDVRRLYVGLFGSNMLNVYQLNT